MPLPIETARDALYNKPGATLAFDGDAMLFESLTIVHPLRGFPQFSAALLDTSNIPEPGSIATVNLSYDGIADEADYIIAEIDEPEGGISADGSVKNVSGSGRLSRLQSGSGVPLLMAGDGIGVTDEAIWTEIMLLTGIGSVLDTSETAFEGYTFCTLDNSFVRVETGQSFVSLLRALDQFLSFETWESPHGQLRRARVNGIDGDPGTIYRDFTEGVDLFDLRLRKRRQDYRNGIWVRATDIAQPGFYPEWSFIDASRTGLQDWEADRVAEIGPHDLITTTADAEFIGNRLFNGVNRIPRTASFTIIGDPIMAPGAYVTINAPSSRLSAGGNWVITQVTQQISGDGWITVCEAEDVWSAGA